MSTQTIEKTDLDPITGKGRVAHIVKKTNDKTAQALVMEARVFGTPVEALCGHTWIPSRDAKQYPICQACKEIYESEVPPEEGLPSD